MPLKWKDRCWLRRFHKVTSGRASVEECEAFGVSDEKRKEFYQARYAKRNDAMGKVIHTKIPMSQDFGARPEDPTDALIEQIDRKRNQ